MGKNKKTNAMRILDKYKVKYNVFTYDTSDGENDGESVAVKICKDPTVVYKTLVTQGISKQTYVFVIPVLGKLNLKKAACVTGEKKIEMIHVKKILTMTGYIKGGCSPVGMKKLYKTYLDQTAKKLDTIIVSAGKIGFQVEVAVEELLNIVEGEIQDVIL